MGKNSSIRALRGMRDIMPHEAGAWQDIEDAARKVFQRFRYREARTPLLEETGLFMRSIGEDTDIVQKEMFSFEDRGGRQVSLRPEGTAPVVRAYLEANLDSTEPFQKLYYIGPMFRAERPQAGRSRQFHQIGVEAIGSSDPAIDAEVISLLTALLDSVGVKGYVIHLNNLGCAEDKARLSEQLKVSFAKEKKLLCEDCQARLSRNALRVLDCKKESCRTIARGIFKETQFLCADCQGHFERTKQCLESIGVDYQVNPYIVRGLDYYTRTVFEVIHKDLGSQDAIGAGGRYDNLIADLGGPSLGACGFALGIERMLMALGVRSPEGKASSAVSVYVATVGDEAHKKGFEVTAGLRRAGVPCDMDYEGKSLKAQMRQADRLGSKFVVILGEDELAKGEAQVRDMATKEQKVVAFSELARILKG